MTNPLPTDGELTEVIARYLKGIHHPDEDPLENELRAMKNTADLKDAIQAYTAQQVEQVRKVDENTSDGYHTFKELYEYRKLYNAVLFNEWAKSGKYSPHKSWRHSDGELCFGGGWFVVCAHLPTGQITNHYEAKDWGLFNIPESKMMDKWDGHTPADVADRLARLTQQTGDNDNEEKK